MAKKFISLKKEISGIRDIEATVKALEKISAADLHYLRMANQKRKEYEELLKRIFIDIFEESPDNLLFQKPPIERRLCIVLSAEKGLCGNLLNTLAAFFEKNLKKKDEILVVGERGRKKLYERGIKTDYFFPAPKGIPKERYTREIKDFVIAKFLKQQYGEVLIFWPGFESLGVQLPKFTTFLPIGREKFEQEIGGEGTGLHLGLPIYEPSKREIIDHLIREYLGLVFYQKVLETKLSELSARTVFMETASEKAKDLIKNLVLQYFREKREMITKDITDLFSHRLTT